MGILARQIRTVRNLKEVIPDSIREAIKNFDFELVDFIKKDQLKKLGQDGKGDRLGDYRLGYRRLRIKKGLQVDHIDLTFSGKFVGSIKIEAQKTQFKITVNVPYDKKIIKRFGEDVLKIQRQFLEEFAKKRILPMIKKNINEQFAKSRIA